MPKKQKTPAQPQSKPLSPEVEDARVKLLTRIPITADQQLDWGKVRESYPDDYETVARFFYRELMWAEGKAAFFVGVHGKGSAAPWAERTHRTAYHDYQAARGEFCNDSLSATLAAEAAADDVASYQHQAAAPEIEDCDEGGDEVTEITANFPEPRCAFWDDIKDRVGLWVRKTASKYDSARGSWRPFLKRAIETDVKDFLDQGKRKQKGDAEKLEPLITGMVDRPDENLSDPRVFEWIRDNDLEEIFFLAEEQVVKLVGEDRAIAIALLEDPRRKNTEIGKLLGLDRRRVSEKLTNIFKVAPALNYGQKLVRAVLTYLRDKDEPTIRTKIQAVRIYNREVKHKNPGCGQGEHLHITPVSAQVKPVAEHMIGRPLAPCPFEVGAWTGNPLSFTPILLPSRGDPILSAGKWRADEPDSVPSPLHVIEVEITDPAAPLHRRRTVAFLNPEQHEPPKNIAPLFAQMDALAARYGWNTVEPGNFGERAARRMDLNERIDPEKVRLKLRKKDAYRHDERQLAASDVRGFIGPVVDLTYLIKHLPDDHRLVQWKHLRAERYWPQSGTCGRWIEDDIQGGSPKAETNVRIDWGYSVRSINKCRAILAAPPDELHGRWLSKLANTKHYRLGAHHQLDARVVLRSNPPPDDWVPYPKERTAVLNPPPAEPGQTIIVLAKWWTLPEVREAAKRPTRRFYVPSLVLLLVFLHQQVFVYPQGYPLNGGYE